jgi:hypothetical protein
MHLFSLATPGGLLYGVAILAVIGLVCGFIAFATGGNTPPPRYQRDPLDDELEKLIDSEREA